MTNLSSARIAEMRTKNEKNVRYIIELKKNMDRTLITILLGNNIVNIILSTIAALIANALFHAVGVSIMVGIITFLIIIFGEITPKHNAIIDSKKVAQKNARTVYYLMRLLNPIIILFIMISRRIIGFRGKTKADIGLFVSDESIKGLATLGEEEGVIKSIERDIIHKVFSFGDKKIEDIMVPMDNVFYLEKNYYMQRVKEIIFQHGFTRVPVINKKKKVIGVVYSKDLIGKERGRVKSLMRPPFMVSAISDVTDIFHAMKRRRIHMAIVGDNKGNHIGIVTLEDILEELVGEIHDEYSDLKEEYTKSKQNNRNSQKTHHEDNTPYDNTP